jgi:hypothetical protein
LLQIKEDQKRLWRPEEEEEEEKEEEEEESTCNPGLRTWERERENGRGEPLVLVS